VQFYHFGKAGRYKLAAPVLKTGSAHAEVGALPTPSASLRHDHTAGLAPCRAEHGDRFSVRVARANGARRLRRFSVTHSL
jgi:hypothetical protein